MWKRQANITSAMFPIIFSLILQFGAVIPRRRLDLKNGKCARHVKHIDLLLAYSAHANFEELKYLCID